MTHAPQPAPRLQLDNLERSFDGPQRSQRKVQISEKVTPRRDNDILNLSGSLGIGEKSARDRQKENYGRELQEQMRRREEKKRLQKKKDEEYDLRMEREVQNYDPFGRGGGGAPVTDKQGRIMADLRHMRNLNNTVENNRDLVFELKDTEQRAVTTPRPPSHGRIELAELEELRHETMNKKITEIYEPRTKVDYSYRDYLEEQMKAKEEKKRLEAEKNRLEDEKLEEKNSKRSRKNAKGKRIR